jgi:hypothetical protein
VCVRMRILRALGLMEGAALQPVTFLPGLIHLTKTLMWG